MPPPPCARVKRLSLVKDLGGADMEDADNRATRLFQLGAVIWPRGKDHLVVIASGRQGQQGGFRRRLTGRPVLRLRR